MVLAHDHLVTRIDGVETVINAAATADETLTVPAGTRWALFNDGTVGRVVAEQVKSVPTSGLAVTNLNDVADGGTFIVQKNADGTATLVPQSAGSGQIAIVDNNGAMSFDGMEFRIGTTARQAEIRALSGTIDIFGASSLQQGSTAQGHGSYSATLTTSWRNVAREGETFSASGATEKFHFRANGNWYRFESIVGPSWNGNVLSIQRVS